MKVITKLGGKNEFRVHCISKSTGIYSLAKKNKVKLKDCKALMDFKARWLSVSKKTVRCINSKWMTDE